ncbi:hypothetical protein ACFU90_37335 [Streptomyces noursei]|uniref:hypothetical protein n=1 Tax=Streptomyces noursei TaxID=1971 RepID=UPI0022C15365|nr:hypothetical protein [Streptomyces noursei]
MAQDQEQEQEQEQIELSYQEPELLVPLMPLCLLRPITGPVPEQREPEDLIREQVLA